MEEAHGVGQSILDEHALSVADNQLASSGVSVIGEEDGWLIMAEILDEELSVGVVEEPDLVFEDPRGLILALGQVESDLAPGLWG